MGRNPNPAYSWEQKSELKHSKKVKNCLTSEKTTKLLNVDEINAET